MNGLKHLSPDSRLWLYQADRKLTPTEMQWLDEQLQAFAGEWATHGQSMLAGGGVINPWFIALAVDMAQVGASGCSIDKSVRLVKDLGKELQVDFFNRLNVWQFENEDTAQKVPFREAASHPEIKIYNPLVDRLGDLQSRFVIHPNELIGA